VRRWTLINAVLLAPVALRAQIQTSPNSGTVEPVMPAYNTFRYEEDWAFMKDHQNSGDRLDHLKYLRVSDNSYLSLGGETRSRYEAYTKTNFGEGPQDGGGYFLQRYLLHADLHVGSSFRTFVQLQSGIVNGRNGGPRPTDKDTLDLHQAFFDLRRGSEQRNLTLRLGRQEIAFGTGRVFGVSEGVNIRRSFDTIRLIWRRGDWTSNLAVGKLVRAKPDIFDDPPDNEQAYWGAGTAHSKSPQDLSESFYYLGFARKNGNFDRGTGAETRHTFGSRLWRTGRLFDINYEVIGQFGTWSGLPIRAWAVSTDTGFTQNFLKAKSRFGLRADVASGDSRRNSLGSFNPLFPSTSYTGSIALFGPTNIVDVEPSFRLMLSRAVTLKFDTAWYWRESLDDGLYSVDLRVIRRSGPTSARFIGTISSARLDWQIDRHFSYTAMYSHFEAGEFMTKTPPGESTDYVTTWILFRF